MAEVEIQYSSKAQKAKDGLSSRVMEILEALIQHLRETDGKPYDRGWKSLGPLEKRGQDVMHCHLTHRVVAIWSIFKEIRKGLGKICVCKFLYIGSREKAPY